jgi:ParB family chromosome partitioning protein
MVDSNLQRDVILPSEKAFAYKYKLEAIKSQGTRTDLTSDQVGQKSDYVSRELISKKTNDSGTQIQRYIRLTNLIIPLLDKVDERKLAFIPAVELSYLGKNEQEWLYDILDREEHFGVPLALATKLKGISKNGKLTYEKIDKIIIEKNQEPPRVVRISYRTVKDYFPKGTTPQEYERVIKQALEEWFENHHLSNYKNKSKPISR